MILVQDSVKHWVPEIQVWRAHVDLGSQGFGPLIEFTFPHSLEEVEVFLNGSIPIRTILSRFGQITPQFSHFLKAEITHESLTILN